MACREKRKKHEDVDNQQQSRAGSVPEALAGPIRARRSNECETDIMLDWKRAIQGVRIAGKSFWLAMVATPSGVSHLNVSSGLGQDFFPVVERAESRAPARAERPGIEETAALLRSVEGADPPKVKFRRSAARSIVDTSECPL